MFGLFKSLTKNDAYENLDAREFMAKLGTTADAVLIDVRTPGEVAAGKIEGAVNLDYFDPSFAARLGKLDQQKKPISSIAAAGSAAPAPAAPCTNWASPNSTIWPAALLPWVDKNPTAPEAFTYWPGASEMAVFSNSIRKEALPVPCWTMQKHCHVKFPSWLTKQRPQGYFYSLSPPNHPLTKQRWKSNLAMLVPPL